MTAAIFAGPTLAPPEIAVVGDFACLPPVAQGDVYRAVRGGARAIGIVDGFFSGAPSVWHKEILWAMAEGVPVFGSASMGALRAAELCAFGMRGVGRIFEAYRDGTLEDDDEVAVLHGPAEIGYLPASEPMVNIRATLGCAVAEGVIGGPARQALERLAKALFYGERNWRALLDATPEGVSAPERAALGAWLPGGRVDQKRLDALAMLAEMQACESATPSPPGFHFEWTWLWDEFVARAAEVGGPGGSIAMERILDELRLEGLEAYRRVEARALLRVLAQGGVRAEPVGRDAERDWLSCFRSARRLYLRADLDRWMSANDIEPAGLEALIRDEARIEALGGRVRATLGPFLIDELRLSGAYPRLAERARRKASAIAAAGRAEAQPTAIASAAHRLWWFETRLALAAPDDLAVVAAGLGFPDLATFDAALARERYFLSLGRESS